MLSLTRGLNENIVIRNADGSYLNMQIISVEDDQIHIAVSTIDALVPPIHKVQPTPPDFLSNTVDVAGR